MATKSYSQKLVKNSISDIYNTDEESDSYRECRKRTTRTNRDLSNLAFKNPGSKFFEPVTGKRKVKCPEQLDLGAVRPIYDDKGLILYSKQDICDCLRHNCPGCFFPCKQCKSLKCGNKCRCEREFYYQRIEIEGTSRIIELNLSEVEPKA